MSLIAIDFDHTICDTGGPKEDDFYLPKPGARDAISKLREDGHEVMIFSCNNPKWIEKWMNHFDIRYDFIWDQPKPVYDLLIDDRAMRFTTWEGFSLER